MTDLSADPQYAVFAVDLNADSGNSDSQGNPAPQPYNMAAAYWHVLRFENSDGASPNPNWTVGLDGQVEISFGTRSSFYIPLLYNNKVISPDYGVHRSWKLRWKAQPLRRAILFVSPNSTLLADTPNPKQLVSSSVGTTAIPTAVSVGAVATQIAAANTGRQSVLVTNNGTDPIYIGNAGVTVATGTPVQPGGSLTINQTSAAIYAISSVAGQDVRVLTEA